MTLEIPLTFDSEKINNFFKKFLPAIKFLGYLIWIGAIIYFFYGYLESKRFFPLYFSAFLFGWLLKEIYNKWKKSKK